MDVSGVLGRLDRDECASQVALSLVVAPGDPVTGGLVNRVGAAQTLLVLADEHSAVPGMDAAQGAFGGAGSQRA